MIKGDEEWYESLRPFMEKAFSTGFLAGWNTRNKWPGLDYEHMAKLKDQKVQEYLDRIDEVMDND